MSSTSIYFMEAGFKAEIPGFKKNFPAASFPFGGNFTFFDFALANFRNIPDSRFTILAGSRFRGLMPFLTSRWAGDPGRLRSLEGGLGQLIEMIKADTAECIVFVPLSLLAIISEGSLQPLLSDPPDSIIKLSIAGVPADIFIAGRQQILKVLQGFQQRGRSSPEVEESLFAEILHTSFELIENVPGRILFQNNLMQLYRENIRLLSLSSHEQMELFSAFHSIRMSTRDCRIEKGAVIKDSLIAFGACIEGCVTGSLIFPGVHVKKNAQVTGSVVMSNNRIGGGSLVQNSLIFPYLRENGKNSSNIGSDVSIGSRRSSARNESYPAQIRDGITVLGLNAEIPSRYRIEAACLIGADVSPQTLRERNFLRRGASIS
jgi:ADP-glucose pyrophosphorylase